MQKKVVLMESLTKIDSELKLHEQGKKPSKKYIIQISDEEAEE